MADGETHFLANVVGGAGMSLLAYTYLPREMVLPVVVGSVIGAFVTPDADLEGRTHSEALLRKIPVVGIVFQVSWYPYALLHRHRGVSHWPVVGTMGRAVYSALAILCLLLFWCGLLWYIGNDPTRIVEVVVTLLWQLANVYVLAAWIAQDLIHLLLDAIWKG